MQYLTTIQIDLFMLLLLLLTVAMVCCKLDRQKSAYGYLIIICSSVIALLLLEIASVVLDSNFNPAMLSSPQWVVIGKLINCFGFSLVPVPAYLLWHFLHDWSGVRQTHKSRIIWLIPILANIALATASYSSNIYFSISNQNQYTRGVFFSLSPLIFYAYHGLAASFLYRHRSLLSTEAKALFFTVIALPPCIGAVQLAVFTILTIWSSWAISCVLLLVGIFVDMSERDELTKLPNRTAYRNAIAKARRMKELKLCVALLDIDGLKSINDAHGHTAGDHAIQKIAQLLRSTVSQAFIPLRLGGDEFAVLKFDNEPNELYEKLCLIEAELDAYNATSGKPYRVAFSYGLACSRDNESVDDLLQRCDKLMYDRKRQKYIKTCP